MRSILTKEMRLSASVLSYLFILFGFMFFLPGYPILCGAFFISFGIFQSFQSAREANDIVFSSLLPIAKKDVVKGKFLFVGFIEICGLIPMIIAIVVRMTILSEAAPYRNNALMNANLFALGLAFLLYGLFNLVFVGGFFKTAYKLGRPFILYIILTFLTIFLGEGVHHFPGCSWVNGFGTEYILGQVILLIVGMILGGLLTMISYKKAVSNFEKIDL